MVVWVLQGGLGHWVDGVDGSIEGQQAVQLSLQHAALVGEICDEEGGKSASCLYICFL